MSNANIRAFAEQPDGGIKRVRDDEKRINPLSLVE